MARLCDLVKINEECYLRLHGDKYRWDGFKLFNSYEIPCEVGTGVLFGESWQLDEPTVESVLEERGYYAVSYQGEWCQIIKQSEVAKGPGNNWINLKHKPATAAEMTRIIDFLESLK